MDKINYRKELSEKEELEGRKKEFKKICFRALCNLGGERHFIALREKVDNKKEWEVIELTSDNIEKIIYDRPTETSCIHFEDMRCLNVVERP